MLKQWIVAATLLTGLALAPTAMAAVDVNQASAAELDGIKGIGPGLSEKILAERKKAPFKDWPDFISRVGGVGEKSAARFSAEGLRVQGKTFGATKSSAAKGTPATTSTPDVPAHSAKPTAAAPGLTAPAAAKAPAAGASPATMPATPSAAPASAAAVKK